MGYSDEPKTYKVYNTITKKFIMSKHVQFIKEKEWDESLHITNNVETMLPHDNKEELVIADTPSRIPSYIYSG